MQSTEVIAVFVGERTESTKDRGEKKSWGWKLHKDKVTVAEILDLHWSQSPHRNMTPKPLSLPK